VSRPKAYVIGAGLSGLSAATILARRGVAVELIEAAGQAGGRCRSYFDAALGLTIDNGNHLVLSGNRAVRAYLARIGAQERLAGPARAQFDFVDLRDGARWRLAPNESALPWWIFAPRRRVPGSHATDYAGFAPLLWAGRRAAIDHAIATTGPVWERLMRPFLLAALNTAPDEASAALAGAVLRQSLLRGGRHYRPRIAHPTLAAAFVDPALAFLEREGAGLRLSTRLKRLGFGHGAVAALELPEGMQPLAEQDVVVLAVPPWVASELVPALTVPNEFRAIVNAHFRVAPPPDAPAMLGVIGGMAEWIFSFPDRISVTVSAADALADENREVLAQRLWADVTKALGIAAPVPSAIPVWQIVKEKRATFAATPCQEARRPAARTAHANLFLAGDWIQTGLPATIEGALKSGERAAALALARLGL
jgi:squalene-associated FAD-dependent desaturase